MSIIPIFIYEFNLAYSVSFRPENCTTTLITSASPATVVAIITPCSIIISTRSLCFGRRTATEVAGIDYAIAPDGPSPTGSIACTSSSVEGVPLLVIVGSVGVDATVGWQPVELSLSSDARSTTLLAFLGILF